MGGQGADPGVFASDRGVKVDLFSSTADILARAASSTVSFQGGGSFLSNDIGDSLYLLFNSFGANLWFNVDGTNSAPLDPLSYGVSSFQVDISSGSSAQDVAAAVKAVVDANSSGNITVTNNLDGTLSFVDLYPGSKIDHGGTISVALGGGIGITQTFSGSDAYSTTASLSRDVIAAKVSTALQATGRFTVTNGPSAGELLITNTQNGQAVTTRDGNSGIVVTDITGPGSGRDDYSVGSLPQGSATLSDLNGDGRPDIIQSNYLTSNVSVLLNQGNGTFAAKTDYAVGSFACSAATLSDLNGDGRPDIIQSNYSTGNVSVLLNQGNGTFAAKTDYAVGGNPYDSASLSDLNGDGRPDIVQTIYNSDTVSVLLNQGDGTFAVKTDYTVGSGSYSSATISDLNGDNRPDIVQSNRTSSTVSVLLNQGNGTFGTNTDYTVGSQPEASATLSDLNGDGRPDIVQSNFSANTVSVLLNQGNGTFAAKTDYTVGNLTYSSATLSDLNGDDRPDIVQSNRLSNTVSVLLNQGNGTFAAKTDYTVGTSPQGAATLSDLNGDGRPDIVQSNTNSSTVSVLLNQGNGQFYTTTSQARQRLIFGDARGMTEINHVDLSTQLKARDSITTLQDRLTKLSRQQGAFGAVQSRLSVASRVLSATRENYIAAYSRIVDTDVAEEAANQVRNSIIQQVASAILSQANLAPQLALRLLRS